MTARVVRAAIYSRCTTDDFRVVDAEIARLTALLESRMPVGRVLAAVPYPEILEAGMGRPGPVLRHLLEAARAREIEAVLVADLAQVGVALARQRDVADALTRANVHLLTEGVVTRWPLRQVQQVEATG